jgi:hypothetical protein
VSQTPLTSDAVGILPVEQLAQVFDGAMNSLAGGFHGDTQSHGDLSMLETKFSNEPTVTMRSYSSLRWRCLHLMV